MEFKGLQEGIVGMRLPNGTVKVIKSTQGHIGEVFENESKFYERFQSINESNGSSVNVSIIESING